MQASDVRRMARDLMWRDQRRVEQASYLRGERGKSAALRWTCGRLCPICDAAVEKLGWVEMRSWAVPQSAWRIEEGRVYRRYRQ